MNTSVSKNDRNKMMGLIAGIIVVFGFAGFRIMGSTAGAPAPAPAPIVATDAAPVSSLTASNLPSDDQIEIPASYLVSNTAPFKMIIPEGGSSSEPAPQVQRPARRPGRILSGMPTTLPPGILPSGNGDIAPLPVGEPGTDPNVQADAILLDGVVSGRDGLAIIRVGTESFVVHAGESFGQGLKVKSISANGAVISNGRTDTTLSVGGSSGRN